MRECRVLMFLSASLRMTAYEMMLEQNRRPLHMAAAHFLEEKIRRLSAGNRAVTETSLYESYLVEQSGDTEERAVLPPTAEEGDAAAEGGGETSGAGAETRDSKKSRLSRSSRKLGTMLRGIRGSRRTAEALVQPTASTAGRPALSIGCV